MSTFPPARATSPMKASGFAALFGLFAGLCAVFAGVVALMDWHGETKQAGWPVVSAVIERANVEISRRPRWQGGREIWNLTLRLRYEVESEMKTARVRSPSINSENEAAHLQSWATRHTGTRVDIRYDPVHPSQVTLASAVPGFVSNRARADFILFITAALASAGLLALARRLVAREALSVPKVDDQKSGNPWLGLLFATPGSAIALAAIDRAPNDAVLASDNCVAIGLGLMFVLAGLLIALPAKYLKWRALLIALVVTLLALSFDWVAFGPGERVFANGLFGRTSGELMGRAVFGAFAVIADICAVAIWLNLFRGRFTGQKPPDSTISPADRSRPTPDRCSAA